MVMVSVVCNTYNHEKYIAEALESFVNQITDFEYEVLVYDDASTDRTADIIRKYEEKYPNLIKAIYQTVNQYSQGLNPGQQNRDRAVGKYIAICEGDDYWIDNRKLQKQFDYMEAHPKCTFCFTNAWLRYGDKLADKPFIPYLDRSAILKKDSNDYNVGELDLMGTVPTASIFFPREIEEMPMPEGAYKDDIFFRLSRTSKGYAHYIDEVACVYRRAVSTSATAVWEKNSQQKIKLCDSMIKMYLGLKANLPNQYDDVFDMRLCQWRIMSAYEREDYVELKKIAVSGDLKLLKLCNTYSRVLYTLQCRFPKFHRNLRGMAKKYLKSFNR